MEEKTLILIKPDGVQRGLIGDVVARFERKGLKLCAVKMLKVDNDLASKHYSVHKDKDFYGRLVAYITSGVVVAMVIKGENAIVNSRNIMGSTFGNEAIPGTIRGDFSTGNKNIVHGSDSPESAEYEIGLYFKPEDIIED